MNSEPKAITNRNHCDSGIPAATPPAMARMRKPEDTMQMSSTAWCLSPKQYASWIPRYTAITTASWGVNHHEIARQPTPSAVAIP